MAEKDAAPSDEFEAPELPDPKMARPSEQPGCACKCGEETGSGGGSG